MQIMKCVRSVTQFKINYITSDVNWSAAVVSFDVSAGEEDVRK